MRALALVLAATALSLSATAGSARAQDAPPETPGWFALTAPVEEVDVAPEGLPAARTRMDAQDVAIAPDGTLLVADYLGVVRRIDADGIVTDVAGRSRARRRGATTEALRTELNNPTAIAALPDGGFYVSDPFERKVRRIGPDGYVSTVARVHADDIAVMPDGGFVATDSGNERVRRVSPDGTVTRFAGTGRYGFRGDGGPAVRARLASPEFVAALPDGSVLVVDSSNDRIRRVDPAGTIDTLARMPSPSGIATTPDGGFAVVDGLDERIWRFDAGGTLLERVVPRSDFAGREVVAGDLIALADGTLLMTENRLWMFSDASAPLTGVAIRDLEIADDRIEATISSTRAGTLILSVGVAEVRTEVEAGVSHIVLREPVARTWNVVEVMLAAGTARGVDRVLVFTGVTLPMRVAKELVKGVLYDNEIAGRVLGCRRSDARRVICVVRGRRGRCRFRAEVTLPTTGIVSSRRRACSRGLASLQHGDDSCFSRHETAR